MTVEDIPGRTRLFRLNSYDLQDYGALSPANNNTFGRNVMSRNDAVRGLFELYEEDPERADRLLFGRIT